MRTTSRWVTISVLLLTACSTKDPVLVRATVQTAPPFTAPSTETPATVGTTIAVTTTTKTTTIPVTTVVEGALTVFKTTQLADEPAAAAYPAVTGEWTDRDLALVAVGAFRQSAIQGRTRKPNLAAFEVWATDEFAPSLVQTVKEIISEGREYRSGSFNDFIVTDVDRADAELVVITSCGRNNEAEYALNDLEDPGDDVLIQDTLGIFRTQWALVRRGSRWLVSGFLKLEASPCAAVFA